MVVQKFNTLLVNCNGKNDFDCMWRAYVSFGEKVLNAHCKDHFEFGWMAKILKRNETNDDDNDQKKKLSRTT